MTKLAEFRNFLTEAKTTDYVQVWEDPTLTEILSSGKFDVKEFKYNISNGTGYVLYTFIPRWMKDAVMMYHTYKYYDMSVVEFLETMSA